MFTAKIVAIFWAVYFFAACIVCEVMRESNRNLDIPPPGIPGEFACLVFEEGGNLTFFSSGRWGICLGGREFEFFF